MSSWKALLTFVFLTQISFARVSEAFDCGDAFATAFPNFISEETLEIDQALLKYSQDLFSGFSPKELKQVLSLIQGTQFEAGIPPGAFVTVGKPFLAIRKNLRNHPLSRFVIAHELVHVKQWLKTGGVKRLKKFFELHHVVNREKEAFAHEYRFFRSVKLQTPFSPSVTEDQNQQLLKLGLDVHSEKPDLVRLKEMRRNNEADASLWIDLYWRAKYDIVLAENAADSLALTEEEYIAKGLAAGTSSYALQTIAHQASMAMLHTGVLALLLKLLGLI